MSNTRNESGYNKTWSYLNYKDIAQESREHILFVFINEIFLNRIIYSESHAPFLQETVKKFY